MMCSTADVQHILPDGNHVCFVVRSLFSKDECEMLLSSDGKNKFRKANSNYPTYYRNNERLVMDDVNLAQTLFEKVKPYLPQTLDISSNSVHENGVWILTGLNERLRFCKYSANQYFHRHLDGIHYRSETVQSKLTFMIYLNDASDFSGGRTLFYKTKLSTEIWAAYIPNLGDLIVFDHNLWHEGEEVSQGEKFVLRSDILYVKTNEKTALPLFQGHLGYIWSLLKFDETIILSGGRDKEIKVWNNVGQLQQSLRGHDNSVLCMEKIDESTFISGSRDQRILIWRKHNNNHFVLSTKLHLHSALVLCLCRLTDSTFASSSGDNMVKISNLEGHCLKTFAEHTNWVWQIVKLDGNHLATASEDCTIKIWNINVDKSIETLKESQPILSLEFNQETKQLVSGGLTGDVSIRTLADNFRQLDLKLFKAHHGIVRAIKFINNMVIATGGEDNRIRIWNIENGQLVREFEHNNFVQAIVLLGSHTLLSASYDGTIKKWTL